MCRLYFFILALIYYVLSTFEYCFLYMCYYYYIFIMYCRLISLCIVVSDVPLYIYYVLLTYITMYCRVWCIIIYFLLCIVELNHYILSCQMCYVLLRIFIMYCRLIYCRLILLFLKCHFFDLTTWSFYIFTI